MTVDGIGGDSFPAVVPATGANSGVLLRRGGVYVTLYDGERVLLVTLLRRWVESRRQDLRTAEALPEVPGELLEELRERCRTELPALQTLIEKLGG